MLIYISISKTHSNCDCESLKDENKMLKAKLQLFHTKFKQLESMIKLQALSKKLTSDR